MLKYCAFFKLKKLANFRTYFPKFAATCTFRNMYINKYLFITIETNGCIKRFKYYRDYHESCRFIHT